MTRLMYDNNAEQSVLGSLLLDNNSWDKISDLLAASDFYKSEHRLIYEAIVKLLCTNKPVDFVILSDKLRTENVLHLVGHESYIIELLKDTPTSANILHYAEVVKRYSVDRQMQSAAHQVLSMIQEQADNRIEMAERLFFRAVEDKVIEPVHIYEGMGETLSNIIHRKENKDKLLGLSTGFIDLDKIIHGLKKSNLIVIAARPSMGKTQLALNIAQHLAFEKKECVLFFSIEMGKEELDLRLISSVNDISHENLQSGNISEADELKIADGNVSICESKLFIDITENISLLDLRAKCRRFKRQHNLKLIIVDYLSLMGGISKENETQRISEISRGLKTLAKELNLPVLALSQLNRSLESRQDKRPIMSDIRQSGQIEQDADIIMFIYRHEIYYPETPAANIAEIIVGKNRSGKTGKIYLTFRGDKCRFENYYGPPPIYSTIVKRKTFEYPRGNDD